MYVSGWAFLIFVIVLIFISALFVDTLVPIVVWTILWSVYVYASNLWSSVSTNLPASSINVRNVAAQQERRARGASAGSGGGASGTGSGGAASGGAGSGLVPTRLPQDSGGNIYDVPQ